MAEKKATTEAKKEDAKTEEVQETKELTFHEKVVAIQTRLNAPKSRFNKFGNYAYRSLEDILEGLKPLLAEFQLLMTITDEVVLIGERYYIKATVTLMETRGGSFYREGLCSIHSTGYAREEESKKGMDGSQITGSASSYARKYALNAMFNIDDTKDADTEEQKMQTERKAEPRALTKEEVEAIEKACAEKEGRKEAVLEWAKVDSFERMTVTQYKQAMERFGK